MKDSENIKKIITRNIFIDTSVFIKENFLLGNKLKAFLKHAEDKEIKLFTTEITIKECLKNLESNFRNSKNLYEKLIKSLGNKGSILKNVDQIYELFNPVFFEPEKELENLKEKFSKMMKDNFSILPIDQTVTLKIFDDYFKENSPFKEGNKKSEFPDAFVLNSIESWCKKFDERMYVVSTDPDFGSFISHNLIQIKDYDELLNLISYTNSSEENIQRINDRIDKNSQLIGERIKMNFQKQFPTDGLDSNYFFEYEVQNFEFINVHIINKSILSTEIGRATVELDVIIEYSVEVNYEDLNTGFYDKEDNVYYGTELGNQMITGSENLDVELIIDFEVPGDPEFMEIESIEIVDGIPKTVAIE